MRFFKYWSQMRLMFSIARADFEVDPLTYNRKTYLSSRALAVGSGNSRANPNFRFAAALLFVGLFMAFSNKRFYLSQIESH